MRFCIVIILVFLQLCASAQNSIQKFRTFGNTEGLSDNNINCITKDSRGYLWIGTTEGLNRFDGKHFLNFFSDNTVDNSLNGNIIYDILEYKPGQLLLATNHGLSVYNSLSNQFENEKITNPVLQKNTETVVWSLFLDKQNRIFINYSGIIDVYDNSLTFLYSLTSRPWASYLKGTRVNKEKWFQDSKNRIWLPDDEKGMFIIDEKQQQVYCYKNNPFHYPFFSTVPIRSFLYDEKDSVVWFSIWGMGLEKYNLKTGKHQKQLFNIPLPGERRCINAISKQNNNMLLCAGGQNVYNVDTETLEFKIVNESQPVNKMPAILSSCIVKDDEYSWIGTETNGMIQLPSNDSYIRQLPIPFTIKDFTSYSSGIVRSQNGLIYLAYGLEGLVEVDPKTYVARRYKIPSGKKLSSVFRICNDNNNQLWIGTTAGLYFFNITTKQFTRTVLPSFTEKQYVGFMFNDSKGNLWMSFTNPNSIGYYNTSEKKFYYYEHYVVDGKAVFNKNDAISRITEDPNGNIWMISFQKGGLLCFESASKKWKLYPHSPQNKKMLAETGLNSIAAAEKNSIWLSNIYGLGLAKYNYSTDSISFLTRKDGLLSNNIFTITKDNHNNLFLVSASGINFFNTHTNQIRSLTLNNENVNFNFAYFQFYDSGSNQLVYGINDRIIFINNKIWQSGNTQQVAYIDGIAVNNKNYYIHPGKEILSLSHSQKNISINFSSNSYNENGSLSYAWKMDGVDKIWNYSNEITTANYANLSPGKYIFLVKAKNSSSDWGPENNSLRFVIHPAFWQTTWFKVCIFLFIAGLVYWLIQRRIKTIHKEAELKQKLSETEMLALRAQMNPHFIFNCLNAIDNLIQTNQKDKATTYLARFAKLIRSVLESSQNNLVPFHKDFETLRLFLDLEQFRCSNKFKYQLEADEELLQGDYKVPPLVIQPFIENAIHHGLLNKQNGEKKLIVKASLHHSYIQYFISDNGVGRTKAFEIKKLNKPEHTSYGIQITTERIHLHNQNGKTNDIQIKDLLQDDGPSGTEVKVRINI